MEATKKFELIGVGSPVVDSLAHVPEAFLTEAGGAKGGMELVGPDGIAKLMAALEKPAVEAPGGSAGNTAVGVAHLGLPTTFLGKLGNDVGGEYYRDSFVRMGGDASRFKMGDVPNGRCLSLVTPDSERTMRTDLGAAMTLTPDEVSVADFQDVRHAHIEGYLLFNNVLMMKVLKSAKEAGCTISLDLASFEVVNATLDVLGDILRDYVDVIFANEEEAAAFCGEGKTPQEMVEQFAELCDIAVVKLGKRGSLIRHSGATIEVDPILIDQPVDTTGAGDLWAAGFLYGWLSGKDLATAGRYGSILGAEVVQILGAAIPHDRWELIKAEMKS